VNINSSVASAISTVVTFYSAQRIDVTVDAYSWLSLAPGSHDVIVTDLEGQSATLLNAFSIDNPSSVALGRTTSPAQGATRTSQLRQAAAKTRKVIFDTSRVVRPIPPSAAPAARGQDATTAAMKAQFHQLQKSHHELAHKVEGILEKITEFLEVKGNKGKHKGD
jgi:hypothetical protein